MNNLSELVLGGDVENIRRARRFARQAAERSTVDVDPDDVELVVSELVANAILHGSPPVRVLFWDRPGILRVEVADSGPGIPVAPVPDSYGVGAWGLRIVESVSPRWGVDGLPHGGKVVWAELVTRGAPLGRPAGPVVSVDTRQHPNDPGEPLYTVRLGAVPTGLLVDAKSFVDDVVREVALSRTVPSTPDPPASRAVSDLIDAALNDFAEVRAEIKFQAWGAARRGEPETHITLALPASAAEAAQRYLEALEELDHWARASRLLTLAAPADHYVLHRWYLTSIIRHLEAVTTGKNPPQQPTFAETLARAVRELSTVRDDSDRLALLEKVTGELSSASTVEHVADTVMASAIEFLGALMVRVYVLGDDRMLRCVTSRGSLPELADQYLAFSLDDDLPGSVAVRTGRALVMPNRAEIEKWYPAGTAYPVERVLNILPLAAVDGPLGCLILAFPEGSRIEEANQASLLSSLASTVAQALERILLQAKLDQANQRLASLTGDED